MSALGTVLVLTGIDDDTADVVVTQLGKRGTTVARMDTGDFPQRLRLAATITGERWTGQLATDDAIVELAEVGAVCYRRHDPLP